MIRVTSSYDISQVECRQCLEDRSISAFGIEIMYALQKMMFHFSSFGQLSPCQLNQLP